MFTTSVEAIDDLSLLAVSNTGDSVINWAIGSHYFSPVLALTFQVAKHHRLLAPTQMHTILVAVFRVNLDFQSRVMRIMSILNPHGTSQSSPYPLSHNPTKSSSNVPSALHLHTLLEPAMLLHKSGTPYL